MSTRHLQEKWEPILGHEDLPEIKDSYRKAVTAQLLENQEAFCREQAALGQSTSLLTEAPTNAVGANGFEQGADAAGPVAGFDPVLIGLIRRAMPNLMAYDICGVQPMSGPTGLIFSMRALYASNNGSGTVALSNEALFDEANPGFSNALGATSGADGAPGEQNPGLLNDASGGGVTAGNYDPILSAMGGMDKGGGTGLEDAGSTNAASFREMGFSIEKSVVEAKGRALKAQYSLELAQDLRAIHGLDAEAELANILPLRSSLKSTAKFFVPCIRPLCPVLRTTLPTKACSTSTSTPMVVGPLRNSRVFSSKSSVIVTQSPKRLVEGRVT